MIPGGVYDGVCVYVCVVCVVCVRVCMMCVMPHQISGHSLLEQRIGFLSQRLILIGINRFLLPYA